MKRRTKFGLLMTIRKKEPNRAAYAKLGIVPRLIKSAAFGGLGKSGWHGFNHGFERLQKKKERERDSKEN